MAIEIKVPSVGESINEVTLIKWMKKNGDYVERDEVIAELESEKATFEINATNAGILTLVANEGDTLKIGDVACRIDETAAKPENSQPKEEVKSEEKKPEEKREEPKKEEVSSIQSSQLPPPPDKERTPNTTPLAAVILADKKVDVKNIIPSGSNGKY